MAYLIGFAFCLVCLVLLCIGLGVAENVPRKQ